MAGFPGVEEGGGKGKEGSGLDPEGGHFGGGGVTVKEEAGRQGEELSQHALEFRPGPEAMEGHGAVEIPSDFEVALEDVDLIGEIRLRHPKVEACFAEGGVWGLSEGLEEGGVPVCGAFFLPPGVEAQGGEGAWDLAGELKDGGPIGFAGGVEGPGLDAGGAGGGEEGRKVGEAGVLKMAVGVEEAHGREKGRDKKREVWGGLEGC